MIQHKRNLPARRRKRVFSSAPIAGRIRKKPENRELRSDSMRSAVVTAILAVVLCANGIQTFFSTDAEVSVFAPIHEIHEYFDETVRENEAAAVFFWGGTDEEKQFS